MRTTLPTAMATHACLLARRQRAASGARPAAAAVCPRPAPPPLRPSCLPAAQGWRATQHTARCPACHIPASGPAKPLQGRAHDKLPDPMDLFKHWPCKPGKAASLCLREQHLWGVRRARHVVQQDEAPLREHAPHIGAPRGAHEHQAVKGAPSLLQQPCT